MSKGTTAGDVIAAILECAGVRVAFGVISIHNMPILDAVGRRGAIRCVPSRGEQGAVNMADAYARVANALGVAFTSTGTGAGNACGALVEAMTAGTPLLHITGQIDTPYLDRGLGFIHEADDQLSMLAAVSKRAYRVRAPEAVVGTLREAIAVACSAPGGPVSVEIPVDVQAASLAMPPREELLPLAIEALPFDEAAIDAIARELASARRPLLWLGGGARDASGAASAFVERGWGAVTSVHGRGIIPEDHERSLAAFNASPAVEELYRSCDAMLVAGSRLRGNETFGYKLGLPPLYRLDAAASRRDGPYASRFAVADAARGLAAIARRLDGTRVDPGFARDIRAARTQAEEALRRSLGPYAAIVAALERHVPDDFVWVRDVTVSNSTWGNRLPALRAPRRGVHALGGGIGQGVPMAAGAAIAAEECGLKTFALAGDGGLALSLGEIATFVQERADVLLIVMNDGGYGVIRNIQDDRFGGRRFLVDMHAPDLQQFAESLGLPSARVRDEQTFEQAIADFGKRRGPALVEVDMLAIGSFAERFAGPPARVATVAP